MDRSAGSLGKALSALFTERAARSFPRAWMCRRTDSRCSGPGVVHHARVDGPLVVLTRAWMDREQACVASSFRGWPASVFAPRVIRWHGPDVSSPRRARMTRRRALRHRSTAPASAPGWSTTGCGSLDQIGVVRVRADGPLRGCNRFDAGGPRDADGPTQPVPPFEVFFGLRSKAHDADGPKILDDPCHPACADLQADGPWPVVADSMLAHPRMARRAQCCQRRPRFSHAFADGPTTIEPCSSRSTRGHARRAMARTTVRSTTVRSLVRMA